MVIMGALPDDVSMSRGPIEEFDELYGFVRATNIAQSGRPLLDRDFLEANLTMPAFDQADGMRFVRDDAGALIGVAWLDTRAPFVESYGRGFVSPHRLGEGIGSALLDWQLQTARERISLADEDVRIAIKLGIDPAHHPSVELVESRGFGPGRFFLEMRIDFDDRPTARPLPEGITYRPFDSEDVVPLVKSIDDAFRDHYGYVETPIEEETERFRRYMDQPSFDPTLVWIAYDRDQIAGSNICIGSFEDDDSVGYVANLAVGRPWRGRGLAKSMLGAAFEEFVRRGKKAATLHVDADSLTGATRLYESVGMREVFRSAVYQRELRAGRDIVQR